MRAYLRLLRPAQWVKNVFVLAGLAFGNKLLDVQGLLWAGVAFAAFCIASSIVYIINDIADLESDRQHPSKRMRPLASGEVTVSEALAIAATLLVGLGLVVTLGLGHRPVCGVIIGAYLVMNLFYSLALKKVMILDVILIAVGFVLRAYAGAIAIEVFVSPWLIVCTFTLCLFLGFGKRRCELAVMGSQGQAERHRSTLAEYTPELLNQCLTISAGVAIVTFLLYTLEPAAVLNGAGQPVPPPPFDKQKLMYTLPLVVYGIFRYVMLIASGRVTGPTDVLIRDRPFLLTVLLWILSVQVIIWVTATQ